MTFRYLSAAGGVWFSQQEQEPLALHLRVVGVPSSRNALQCAAVVMPFSLLQAAIDELVAVSVTRKSDTFFSSTPIPNVRIRTVMCTAS